MPNPPRPSIAQPSRKSRLRTRGVPDTAPGHLTMSKPAAPSRAPEPKAAEHPRPAEPSQAVEAKAVERPKPMGLPKPPMALSRASASPSRAAESPGLAPAAATLAEPTAPVLPGRLDNSPAQAPASLPPAKSYAPSTEPDSLAAGLRPRLLPAEEAPGRAKWPLALGAFALLAVGGIAGYLAGMAQNPPPRKENAASLTANSIARASSVPSPPLTPELQRDLDAAFDAMKNGQFPDARKRFADLLRQRPDWAALNFEIARAALYQRDFDAAEAVVEAGRGSGAISAADGEFLLALLRMNTKRFDFADHSFERAAAADPTRADIYYFWGDCLRREGKPLEASEKLHAAVLRNQYETATSLYQTKFWLSEIQADRETASGSSAAIDAGLADPHPSSAVLFAAAAREIKAGKIASAVPCIDRARQIMEPSVFRVVMQDPTFMQESWRPEMLTFYRQPAPEAGAPSPVAANAPSPAPSPQAGETQPKPPETAAPSPSPADAQPSPAPSPQASEAAQPTAPPETAASSPAPSPQASEKPAATPQARVVKPAAPAPRAKPKPAASPQGRENADKLTPPSREARPSSAEHPAPQGRTP